MWWVGVATDHPNLGVFGYAIDPDAPPAIRVRVTIDGVGTWVVPTGFVWDEQPNWVGSQYGKDDGFVFLTADLPPGTHTVCAAAIDSAGAGEFPIGCRQIMIK